MEFYKKPRKGGYNIGGGRYSNCSIIEALNLVESISKTSIKEKSLKHLELVITYGIYLIPLSLKTLSQLKQKYNTKKIIEELIEHQNKNIYKLVFDIFKKYKLSSKHARIATGALINAELVGAYGHGLSRLRMYCDRISKKVINAKPKIIIKEFLLQFLILMQIMVLALLQLIWIKTAIKHAQKTGIGMVAVKNSGHYGLSGYYAEQAVKKNLIVMIYTNAPPAIAPHGALKSLFGTNPICFGSPTGSKIPFILDTSISMINRGKIRVAARNNQSIPPGVALDKFGKPTTDAKALAGVQLPIAGFEALD